jgi:hypothetical protein
MIFPVLALDAGAKTIGEVGLRWTAPAFETFCPFSVGCRRADYLRSSHCEKCGCEIIPANINPLSKTFIARMKAAPMLKYGDHPSHVKFKGGK